MPRIDFTMDELEQFEPQTREALLRLYRQKLAAAPAPEQVQQARGLGVVEEKTPDELAKEFESHYKDGGIWHPRY